MQKKPGDAASTPATIPSEGHRLVSWIWRQLGESASEEEHIYEGKQSTLQECFYYSLFLPNLWIEFCKSKAHADCWREEIQLLSEEMHHVIDFFGYQANTWASGALNMLWSVDGANGADMALREGCITYAKEQSAQFLNMVWYCGNLWCVVPQYIKLGSGDIIPLEAKGAEEDQDV